MSSCEEGGEGAGPLVETEEPAVCSCSCMTEAMVAENPAARSCAGSAGTRKSACVFGAAAVVGTPALMRADGAMEIGVREMDGVRPHSPRPARRREKGEAGRGHEKLTGNVLVNGVDSSVVAAGPAAAAEAGVDESGAMTEFIGATDV